MDFTLNTRQQELESNTQFFAENEIAPYTEKLEEDIEFRLELFQKMARHGLFLLSISHCHGAAHDPLGYLLALKAIAKTDAGISVTMAVINMAAETISHFGTEDQKLRYIPKIASGECVPISFALTEKNAGSDAKSIQTEAVRKGKRYIISGEKQFITNGDLSSLIIVFAKTDSGKGKGREGITAFLVEKGTPGLSVVKKERKLGLLSANLVSLKFDQCAIPEENRLGEEGHGFKIAMMSLDNGRLGIAAQALGIAEAAYEAALNHAKHRHQFGHAIAENQAIAFKLADMHVKLNAGKLLMYHAAWKKDLGKPYTLEASEAKLFCSESCNEIVDEALQIFGGYGYVKDYPLEKYFRDARVTTLYEGTSEIQRIVISRQILSSSQL